MKTPSVLAGVAVAAFAAAEATGIAQILGLRGHLLSSLHLGFDLLLLVSALPLAWMLRGALAGHIEGFLIRVAAGIGILFAAGGIVCAFAVPGGLHGGHDRDGGPRMGPPTAQGAPCTDAASAPNGAQPAGPGAPGQGPRPEGDGWGPGSGR